MAFPSQLVPTTVFLSNSFAFFVSVFLSGVLLLTVLSRTEIKRTSKAVLSAFVVILLPPIIDLFTNNTVYYDYIYDSAQSIFTPNWIYSIKSYAAFGFGVKGVTIGLQLEILAFIVLSTIYVALRTRSMMRTLITPFAVYGLAFFYGSVPYIFAFGNLSESFNNTHNLQYLTSVFLILITVQSGLWLFLYERRFFRIVARGFATERSINYMIMTGFGAFLVGAGVYPALIAMLCVLMLWQCASAINNLADVAGDSLTKGWNPLLNGLGEQEVKILALLAGLLALSFSIVLGFSTTVAALTIIALSVIYSYPPWRLKKYPFIATAVISLGALLGVSIGFYSIPTSAVLPNNLVLTILLCFTLTFNTKDLKDYEGDRLEGIHTLPVMLGPTMGRNTIAILDFVAISLVPVLLQVNILLIPALVLGAATSLLVLKMRSESQIFLPYFVLLALLLLFYRLP